MAYETLTRAPRDPRGFEPGEFFAEWVEEEMGLVGAERTMAFAALAKEIGFAISLVRPSSKLRPGDGGFSSKVNEEEGEYPAVVATIEGRRILADVAFPLPVVLSLDPPASDIPTAWGKLSIDLGGDQVVVTCDARGELAGLVRLHLRDGANFLPFEEISRTSPAASPRLATGRPPAPPFALRLLDDRVLFWSRGRMTILDSWSLLSFPLPPSERKALETLFALNLDGVQIEQPAADPDEPPVPAVLTVYHASPLAPDEVRRRLPLEGDEPTLLSRRELLVEPASEGSRIALSATFDKPVPPAGPGEAVRKTLVFHLASELLALSR